MYLEGKRKVCFIKVPLLFSQWAQNKRQEYIFIFWLIFFRGPPPNLNAKKFHFFSHFPVKYIYTNGNKIHHNFFLHFHDFQHIPNLTRTMERHKFNILWVDVDLARDRHESVSNMMQWNKVNEVEMPHQSNHQS